MAMVPPTSLPEAGKRDAIFHDPLDTGGGVSVEPGTVVGGEVTGTPGLLEPPPEDDPPLLRLVVVVRLEPPPLDAAVVVVTRAVVGGAVVVAGRTVVVVVT